jgi:hypothetical protein
MRTAASSGSACSAVFEGVENLVGKRFIELGRDDDAAREKSQIPPAFPGLSERHKLGQGFARFSR